MTWKKTTFIIIGIVILVVGGYLMLYPKSWERLKQAALEPLNLKGFLLFTSPPVGGEWNISNSTYTGLKFNVSIKEITPKGLFFSSDGLNMYTTGSAGARVYQYLLSTEWNVSTSSYLQNKTSSESSPRSIYFKSDGLKYYIIGISSTVIFESNMTQAWNISNATLFSQSASLTKDGSPQGLFFSSDGLYAYVAGNDFDSIYQYNMSTPWRASSIVYERNKSIVAQTTNPQGVSFSSDGLHMYVDDAATIYEYNLTQAWNVSTATFLRSKTVNPSNSAGDMYFRNDGQRYYVIDDGVSGNDSVYQFAMGNGAYPPDANNVSIVPAYPTNLTASLNCTANITDVDGGNTTYQYYLYNGSTVMNNTNITLPQGTLYTLNFTQTLNTNEIWKCQIRGNDTSLDSSGNVLQSNFVESHVVINNLPLADIVLITPSSPSTSNNLTCFSNWTDSNNATQNLNMSYNWFKNNISLSLVNMPFNINSNSSNYSSNQDISFYNNIITINRGNPSYTPKGMQGGAYILNGSSGALGDSFKILNTENNSLLKNFTVSMWIEPDATTSLEIVLSKNYTGSLNNGTFYVAYQRDPGLNTNFTSYIGTGTGTYSSIDTQPYGSDLVGKWFQLVVVLKSGQSIAVYVNGTLVGSSALTATTFLNGSGDWIVGSLDATSNFNFNGVMDNLRIDNYSMTVQQINTLKNSEYSGLTNTSIIDSSYLTNGDLWTCQAFASDSYMYSTQKNASVTISSTDTTPPTYSNIRVNNTSPGILEDILFSVLWSDNTALANYTFSWNATGLSCDTWANNSVVGFSGTLNWSNVTMQLPASCLLGALPGIAWRVWANDSSGNINVTPVTLSFSSAGSTNCWTYNTATKTRYVPSGCTYYGSSYG